jgi:hypothetical protein
MYFIWPRREEKNQEHSENSRFSGDVGQRRHRSLTTEHLPLLVVPSQEGAGERHGIERDACKMLVSTRYQQHPSTRQQEIVRAAQRPVWRSSRCDSDQTEQFDIKLVQVVPHLLGATIVP